VVQEEPGIAGRCEEISARVASDPEVTTSVHAKVAGREVALHSVLEARNAGAVADELVCRGQWLAELLAPMIVVQLTADRLGRAPACACIRQIAAQAALIEPQSVGLRVGLQAVQ